MRPHRGSSDNDAPSPTGQFARSGKVYLVGAGPGDPHLVTGHAYRAVTEADVILHDKLIPHALLDARRPDAELIDVGKIGGGDQVPQETTTALMIEHARAGKNVVRLKGGDPFVFGRGGEEALACVENGIPFEVIPGVTAGVAAAAYAGIPVTHRGLSTAVAFVTGHTKDDETDLGFQGLAAFPGTLVFYMGVRQLPAITEQLIAAGRPADEPAAIVEQGTLPGQRTVRAPLADIAAAAQAAAVKAPAITIVGAVAGLSEDLDWLRAARPLGGRSVVVTRARAQASEFADKLERLGAQVVPAHAIRIEPLPAELPDVAGFDLVVFTSVNAVERFFDLARDARALAGPTVAAIGPGTAGALRSRGIHADVVPDRSIAESLVEALADVPVKRALIPRAETAREVLPDALRARGAEVEVLPLYRTVAEPLSEEDRAAVLAADYVTFTSASGVRFFHEAAGTLEGPCIASIGPATSAALRELGYEPDIEAATHTPDGLIEALLQDAG